MYPNLLNNFFILDIFLSITFKFFSSTLLLGDEQIHLCSFLIFEFIS
jgi:hypothetical protein